MLNRTEQNRTGFKYVVLNSIQDRNIERPCDPEINSGRRARFAFTLAEVLITLGIIGIVAGMTIPTLMNNVQDIQYKTAYKKAYSELCQAFNAAQSADELAAPSGSGWGADHRANFYAIRDKFKVVKICPPSNLGECWALTGELFGNAYTSGLPSSTYGWGSDSFIDTAGMQWAQTRGNTSLYAVDTNGLKVPNEYGKDRFIFKLIDKNGASEGSMDIPIKVIVPPDNYGDACCNNKCATTKTYFATSWLLQ